MMLAQRTGNLARGALLAAGMLALAGCSSTDTFEQPAPVPDVTGSVDIDDVWTTSIGDGLDGELLQLSPVYAGDTIYAVSADGVVASVRSEDGDMVWEKDLDTRLFAGPGVDGEQLYVVTRGAELIALSNTDGTELWRIELPTEALASPQSNGNLVAVQTIDGRMLAFDTISGDQLWQYQAQVPVLTMRSTAAPLVGGDVVIGSFANGRVMALSASDGQPLWQYQVGQPSGRTELERLVDIGGQPLVLDRALMVVGYQGKLALIEIRSGQEIWSRPASSLYSPAVGDGRIFLSAANGDVLALRGSDRRELWVQDSLSWRQLTGPAVVGDYLVVGDYEGYLHVLSAEDGSLVGQWQFDSDGIRAPIRVIEGDKLLVYGNSGDLAVLELQPDD